MPVTKIAGGLSFSGGLAAAEIRDQYTRAAVFPLGVKGAPSLAADPCFASELFPFLLKIFHFA